MTAENISSETHFEKKSMITGRISAVNRVKFDQISSQNSINLTLKKPQWLGQTKHLAFSYLVKVTKIK